ncbi:MAG: NAD(P)H-binding protein, partial [Bacteroidota bacterium]
MQKTAKNITLLGTGWLGLPLLRALVADGHRVAGSGRQPERLRAITEAGGQAFAIDLPGPIPQAFLKECDCLIITLPPRGRQLGADAADQYLAALRSLPPLTHLSQLIYTSSTGVYGNQPGLVNEATPRQPATHSARAVAAAEDWLRANHPAVTILRLAGLIGPGRHPGNFFGGRSRAIPDGDAPVNLVHRQDVIAAIRLVLSEPSPGV